MNDNYFFSSMDTSQKGLKVALFKDFDESSLGETFIHTDFSLKLKGKHERKAKNYSPLPCLDYNIRGGLKIVLG